jgi:hypothetical protein
MLSYPPLTNLGKDSAFISFIAHAAPCPWMAEWIFQNVFLPAVWQNIDCDV